LEGRSMEVMGAVLLVLATTSLKELVSSLAYRNRARGDAEIIRALAETKSGRGKRDKASG
jgi:hypothetical protein